MDKVWTVEASLGSQTSNKIDLTLIEMCGEGTYGGEASNIKGSAIAHVLMHL